MTITWADNAIRNQWLQVTVLANADTGLAEADVFYFGNAVGESGNSMSDAKINAYDMLAARNHPRTFADPAPVDFAFDYDRDGRVNATDVLIARNHQTHFANALELITVPTVPTPPPAHDAVFERAAEREADSPEVFSDRLAWLYQYEGMSGQRPSEKDNRLGEAVDKLLAGLGQ